ASAASVGKREPARGCRHLPVCLFVCLINTLQNQSLTAGGPVWMFRLQLLHFSSGRALIFGTLSEMGSQGANDKRRGLLGQIEFDGHLPHNSCDSSQRALPPSLQRNLIPPEALQPLSLVSSSIPQTR